MIGKCEREEVPLKIMDKKEILNYIFKNRVLILFCAVLVFGTIFGTSMLNFVPEEISENFYNFISKSNNNFSSVFINKFTFPFLMLFGIFLSGTSTLGNILSIFMILINGVIFGFENALNYKFSGTDYIVINMTNFFSGALFFNFIMIIMAENSFFSSKQLCKSINSSINEKPHYNAKKQYVKFITFTFVFAIFSAISSVFCRFIQSVI